MVKDIEVRFRDGSRGRFSAEHADLGKVIESIKGIPGYQWVGMDGAYGPVTPEPPTQLYPGQILTGEIKTRGSLDTETADKVETDPNLAVTDFRSENERLKEENRRLRRVLDFMLKEVL